MTVTWKGVWHWQEAASIACMSISSIPGIPFTSSKTDRPDFPWTVLIWSRSRSYQVNPREERKDPSCHKCHLSRASAWAFRDAPAPRAQYNNILTVWNGHFLGKESYTVKEIQYGWRISGSSVLLLPDMDCSHS